MNLDSEIKERYCFIKGYENYIITESGDVYTYRNDNAPSYRGLRKLKKKGINNPKRYLQVCLSKNNKKKYVEIHRLVAEYFCDGYFEGAVVNHIDGDIHNNDYTNLEWVTQKDNVNKGYKTSGVNQLRNYKKWKIIYPDGKESYVLNGRSEIINYIKDNNLNISASMIIKHKNNKGYKLIECA